MVYRNGGAKKEGNKGSMMIQIFWIVLYLALLYHIHVAKNRTIRTIIDPLFPSFLHHHMHCLQILYTLISQRECFLYLVTIVNTAKGSTAAAEPGGY